jgi:hypothetical protein
MNVKHGGWDVRQRRPVFGPKPIRWYASPMSEIGLVPKKPSNVSFSAYVAASARRDAA